MADPSKRDIKSRLKLGGDEGNEDEMRNQENQIKKNGKAEQRDKKTDTKGPGPGVAKAVGEWLMFGGVAGLSWRSVE